jgi:hypothetical protein
VRDLDFERGTRGAKGLITRPRFWAQLTPDLVSEGHELGRGFSPTGIGYERGSGQVLAIHGAEQFFISEHSGHDEKVDQGIESAFVVILPTPPMTYRMTG